MVNDNGIYAPLGLSQVFLCGGVYYLMFLGELLSNKALSFYQFTDPPFADVPDPAGLFVSPSHRAALQAITSSIEARQGLVIFTSEVGLGKTTVVRAYLDTVDPQQV